MIYDLAKLKSNISHLDEYKVYNELMTNLEKYNQERIQKIFKPSAYLVPNYDYFFEIDAQIKHIVDKYLEDYEDDTSKKFKKFVYLWGVERDGVIKNYSVDGIKDIEIDILSSFLDFFVHRNDNNKHLYSSYTPNTLGLKLLLKSLNIVKESQNLREIMLLYLQTDSDVMPKEEIKILKTSLLMHYKEFNFILESYKSKYEDLLDFLFLRLSNTFQNSYESYISKFLDDTTDKVLLENDVILASSEIVTIMDLLTYMLNVEYDYYQSESDKVYEILKVVNLLFLSLTLIYVLGYVICLLFGKEIEAKFLNLQYGVKIFVLFVSMIFLSNILLILGMYYVNSSIVLKEIHNKNKLNIKFAVEQFNYELDILRKNMTFLSSKIDFFKKNDFSKIEVLAKYMLSNYNYIDFSIVSYEDYGDEVFKVVKDSLSNEIQILGKDKLGNYAKEIDFQKGIKLKQGQIYFSDISLEEISNGKIYKVGQQIVAIAPVYKNNLLVYVLRLTMDCTEVFDSMKNYFSSFGELAILDKNKNYLNYEDSSQKEKDFSLKNFSDVHGDITFEHSVSYKVLGNAITHNNEDLFLQYIKVPFNLDLNNSNYIWVVYALKDKVELSDSKIFYVYFLFMILVLMPLALTTSLLFSRIMINPINQITLALKYFGEGKKEFDLPTQQKDEIGFLATNFSNMMKNISEHERSTDFVKNVAIIANEYQSFDVAIEKIFICFRKYYNWDLFHLFLKNKGEFVDSKIWYYNKNDSSVDFERKCEQVITMSQDSFSNSNDIFDVLYPSILSSEIYAVSNLKSSRHQHRTRILTTNGFSSLLFIPIFLGKEIVGVIDVYAQKHMDVNNKFLNTMETLAIQISRIIYRHNSETILYTYQTDLEKMVLDKTKELKCAKENAENANRMKDELLANISHEFRTPLHSIMGFSNILIKKIDNLTKEEQLKKLSFINSSGMQLLDLVNNLLDMSKLESKKVLLNIEEVDLINLLEEVNGELMPQLFNKNLSVNIKTKLDTISIDADRILLKQLCRNILSNAIKFSKSETLITIEVVDYPDEKMVSVSYKNIGKVIPHQELKNIFDKFVQSSATKDISGGTGLGLAICREIVYYHNGKISIDNLLDNTGVEVNFILPYYHVEKKKNV